MFLICICLAVAVQSLKPSREWISVWLCRWTSFSSGNYGHCWLLPYSLPFFVSSSQFPCKYLKQHSQLPLRRKEVPMCHRVNVFLFLGDKIAPERAISPPLLLHWEVKLFPPLAEEVWLWNCRKRALVSCWTNSYLCNTTGGRYPMWHQISTGNQDHHVFGSWEVFAASSLFSESSLSGVSRGTNLEKQRKVVNCVSECHGRFHLATYFMLKWVLSSFYSARNDTSVPEKTACAPWSQKYCRKGSRVIGNLTMYHRDWTVLGRGCRWLAFSFKEGFTQFSLAKAAVPSCTHLRCPCSNTASGKRQLTHPANNPLRQWLLGLFGNSLWRGIH